MLPGRLLKTAGPAGSAAAAAAVGSFRGVKHSRGRTKESKAGGIILVNTGKDIRNLLYTRTGQQSTVLVPGNKSTGTVRYRTACSSRRRDKAGRSRSHMAV